MKEQWKTIPGFKWHEVSSHGRVRKLVALRQPFYYKLVPDRNGHLCIQLSNKGDIEHFRVARLVGAAFCQSFKPELRHRHLDGDKTNCRAANLHWVSVSEITAHPYSRQPRPQQAT